MHRHKVVLREEWLDARKGLAWIANPSPSETFIHTATPV